METLFWLAGTAVLCDIASIRSIIQMFGGGDLWVDWSSELQLGRQRQANQWMDGVQ